MQPERGQHGAGHVGRLAHPGQLDEPAAKLACDRGGHLGGQPGLAGAARADQGDQPVIGEPGDHLAQLALPADEAGQPGRQPPAAPTGLAPQVRAGTGGRRQFRVVAQHGEVHPLERGGGLDAQLVGQCPAGAPVDGERVGLPAGQIERLDQERGQPLAQRLLGQPGTQLAEHLLVPAELDVRLDPVLDGGGVQLGQPGGRGAGERRVGHVRHTPPVGHGKIRQFRFPN